MLGRWPLAASPPAMTWSMARIAAVRPRWVRSIASKVAYSVAWVSDGGYKDDNSMEIDLYGGYRGSAGDIGYDVGVITYIYPGDQIAGANDPDTTEVYVGASWKMLSAKYSHVVSNRFVGWGMLHTMQTITFGIADRQPTLSQRASSSVTASAIDPSRLRGVQPSLRTHSEVQPAQANTRSPSRTSPGGRQSQRSRHGSCLRERGMAPSWRTAWPRAADVVPNRLDRSGRPGHGQGGVDRAQPVELVDQGAGGRHHRDVAGLGAGDEVVEREPLGRRRSKVSA